MQDHSCEVTTSRHITNHDWTILSEGEGERERERERERESGGGEGVEERERKLRGNGQYYNNPMRASTCIIRQINS